MRRTIIGIAVTLLAASVQAQTEANDALDDYLFQVRVRYATSVSKVGLAIADAELWELKDGTKATGLDLSATEAYVSASAAEVAAQYQLAVKASATDKKVQGLLRELQDYWVRSMTDVIPGGAEKRRDYERRTAETNRRLKDLATTVVVEACEQAYYCITTKIRRLKDAVGPVPSAARN